MLKPAHLGRYRDLGLLLTRYGLKDFKLDLKSDALLAQADSADEEKPLEPDVQARAKAKSLAERAERAFSTACVLIRCA